MFDNFFEENLDEKNFLSDSIYINNNFPFFEEINSENISKLSSKRQRKELTKEEKIQRNRNNVSKCRKRQIELLKTLSEENKKLKQFINQHICKNCLEKFNNEFNKKFLIINENQNSTLNSNSLNKKIILPTFTLAIIICIFTYNFFNKNEFLTHRKLNEFETKNYFNNNINYFNNNDILNKFNNIYIDFDDFYAILFSKNIINDNFSNKEINYSNYVYINYNNNRLIKNENEFNNINKIDRFNHYFNNNYKNENYILKFNEIQLNNLKNNINKLVYENNITFEIKNNYNNNYINKFLSYNH